MLCLDAITGTLLWDFDTGSDIYSSPSIAGSRIYFTTFGKMLYILKADDGTLEFSMALPGPSDSSPAISGQRVFFGDWAGFIYAFR